MRERIIYLLAAVAAALLCWNLYNIFFVLPVATTNVGAYKIIYFHVPSIFTGFSGFFVALVASSMYLATGNLKYDAFAAAVTEVALAFATIVLATGMIWGRFAWGIWWTWDARLTTTLVLWLIYVSYLLLRRFAAGPQVQTLAAVLGIFGALDVPIVYMSNRWWRTQHPAPVFGGGDGSGMDKSMLDPFLWNMLAWFAWGVLILALRYNVERKHQKNASREQMEALESRV
jgi:heme exporter protein C